MTGEQPIRTQHVAPASEQQLRLDGREGLQGPRQDQHESPSGNQLHRRRKFMKRRPLLCSRQKQKTLFYHELSPHSRKIWRALSGSKKLNGIILPNCLSPSTRERELRATICLEMKSHICFLLSCFHNKDILVYNTNNIT